MYYPSVIKPLETPDLEELEEAPFASQPYSLDYEGCIRINDGGLLHMISERDEVD
jgi:hypothetical protein